MSQEKFIIGAIFFSIILTLVVLFNEFSLLTTLVWGILITIFNYYYFFSQRRKKDKEIHIREILLEKIPVAIVVIDTNGEINWYNTSFKETIGKKGCLTGKLNSYLPGIQFKKNSQFQEILTPQIAIKDKIFQVQVLPLKGDLRVILLKDITEHTIFIQKNRIEKPAIGIIQIDNYSEVLNTIEEDIRPLLLAELDKLIGDWALEKEAYIKKFTDDKYLLFLTQEALKDGEESKFDLLDKIRNLDVGKIPVTISMGFGVSEESFVELGRLAHLSLELALGRGGDQVVVKSPDKVWFYGGKTQALEKRTKVKARVIAHSLQNMIIEGKTVLIMGHEGADFDSLGSSLGLASAIRKLGKTPYIVVDQKNQSLDKLLTVFGGDNLQELFIKGQDLKKIDLKNSLLIVVDTHKPSMVVEASLLTEVEKVVIIDHHRRSEEFIENASLIYLESYASSTAELVTEMIQYFSDEFEIDSWAATALLTGITVDTKNFIFQTGVRTFEAASYLRRIGADPIIVQKLLRDDFTKVTKKAVIIENSRILKGHIAVGIYPEAVADSKILAAQGADALLNIDNITASFVICPMEEGGVTISARSTGETNVQLLMEKLGGGGHLTVAGAQLKDINLTEAEKILLKLIEENY